QERLAEFHVAAGQNESLWEQLHGWTMALLQQLPLPTGNDADAPLIALINTHFDIELIGFHQHAVLADAFFAEQSDPTRELQHRFALSRVFCVSNPPTTLDLLQTAGDEPIRSCAVIDVSDNHRGKRALLLGSSDDARFSPELGSRFLERIGDVIAAAMAIPSPSAEDATKA
ncbi:DUF484 family protein, partial [Gammaproteobacteria bacterium]|nr:DUF484 family protein [Gammaproteobacteria bacterium]